MERENTSPPPSLKVKSHDIDAGTGMLLLPNSTRKLQMDKTQGNFRKGSCSVDDGWGGPTSASPALVCNRQGVGLSRSVNVELTLQDVVDDGLTQVVHDVAISMLQGQSMRGTGNVIGWLLCPHF